MVRCPVFLSTRRALDSILLPWSVRINQIHPFKDRFLCPALPALATEMYCDVGFG
jgi:hypothetical protein